jgi:hypothetical protein
MITTQASYIKMAHHQILSNTRRQRADPLFLSEESMSTTGIGGRGPWRDRDNGRHRARSASPERSVRVSLDQREIQQMHIRFGDLRSEDGKLTYPWPWPDELHRRYREYKNSVAEINLAKEAYKAEKKAATLRCKVLRAKCHFRARI